VQRALALHLLPHRGRFRVAAALGNCARPVRRLLPASLTSMLELLPARLPRRRRLPALLPARGDRRARVALLVGCVQEVVAPEINRAALRVLVHNGVEVVIPPGQGCCGALSLHSGEFEQARALARRNLEAFPQDVDAVVTTAAGCGSGMHEYGLMFDGEPEHDAAERFGSRVLDVSVFLHSLGLREDLPELAAQATAAYHDACHLAHAQGVRQEPRELLRRVAGLTVVEPPEPELCCGSAGTYNIERPEVARELGDRKAANLRATGADLFVTGNIGCISQLRTRLAAVGDSTPVLHTLEVLDRAYAGRSLS
jgi:glycolate oxidase iron-sulfur subunit